MTSTAYDTAGFNGATINNAVRSFNRDQAGAHLVRRFGTVWAPLPVTDSPAPPATLASKSPNPLAPRKQPATRLERFQMPDLGIGFDHDLTGDRRGFFYGMYGSPLQDELLTDLALHLLGDREVALGRRGVTDLLALSFSAHDVVAHGFGSESAEALDALRRLDRDLGRLLARLDELGASEPAGGVLLGLSVYLASERAAWPADELATTFVVNDDFPGRSGDAFLIPRPHVLMHWDPARGSGHGSHHPYDTHVPLIFWGSGVRPAVRAGGCTPYDLAPTLAAALGLQLPQATGKVCAPR